MSGDEKLTAAHFRALCTAIWGRNYRSLAADALDVRESRIKFWSSDEQDNSPHQIGLSVKRELEELFVARLRTDPIVLDRVNQMADVLEYLDELIEESDSLPYH